MYELNEAWAVVFDVWISLHLLCFDVFLLIIFTYGYTMFVAPEI